jgi:hypothetical protein
MAKKTKKTSVRSQDAGTAERPVFVTNPEVQQELQEASRLKPSRQRVAKVKTSASTKLSGGDVDAAADETGSGEEAVGGSVATPDQDIVENLGRAVGITYEDNEELDLLEKVKKRDRKRWELNPSSSEDYQERNQRRR